MTFDGRTVPQWISLTHAGTAGTLRYKVVAGAIYVEANVTIAIPATSQVQLLAPGNEIPVDLRPTMSIWQAIGRMSTLATGNVGRFTDGTIPVYNPTGTAATSIQFAYEYALG